MSSLESLLSIATSSWALNFWMALSGICGFHCAGQKIHGVPSRPVSAFSGSPHIREDCGRIADTSGVRASRGSIFLASWPTTGAFPHASINTRKRLRVWRGC
jgi:hypothetical protein